MDGSRFDALAKTLSLTGTRRRVLGSLAGLPALGGLLALLDQDDAEAKDRRRRRKQRHKKRKDKSQGKRKQRACKPKSRARICAGRCGEVKNRDTCGKAIDCGSCDCTPPCGECFTCQDAGPIAPGTCVVDPAQQWQSCGSNDQVCQPDGACACTATTCAEVGVPCGPLADGCGATLDCGACTCDPTCAVCFTCQDQGPNTPGTCVVDPTQQGDPCGSGNKVCLPDGTCACIPLTECPASKECGTFPDGCGGEVSCPDTCKNPTPVCSDDNICVPCESSEECGDAAICVGGLCAACDVCKSGSCAFTSVQAAIDAMSPQLTTIRVCPGTYTEDCPTPRFAVDIRRPLTLIGAGNGDNPAANTIIKPAQPSDTVMLIYLAGTVRLEGVRITGGDGQFGRGMNVGDCTLTLAQCTIAGNTCGNACNILEPGGIDIFENGHVTLIDSHVVNNTGGADGGILLKGGSLTLDTLSRVTGNHAVDAPTRAGGITGNSFPVFLPSAENVTGNTPNNCQGSGFTGAGAICTSS
jgi:hypothetical protein